MEQVVNQDLVLFLLEDVLRIVVVPIQLQFVTLRVINVSNALLTLNVLIQISRFVWTFNAEVEDFNMRN